MGNNRHQTYFSTLEDPVSADNPARFMPARNGTGRDAVIDKLWLVKMPIAIGIDRLAAKGKNIPWPSGLAVIPVANKLLKQVLVRRGV